ncbi:lantibiotic dehydratase C-terminal domain-containing protein [Streptosporangium sp. NPDC051023]|uniref:lantibiotic dehydratase C-terminal domain-containing protein n=1 Tax=Streptosporangium sp. NPDC051023 TaxID=3155410 RepID=UPI00344E452F
MTEESEWISLHAFHRGDLDRLVAQAVVPLVKELPLRGWFFLRYWEGGPHLRLRLLPEPGRRAEVVGTARGALADHLAANPSPPGFDAEGYAKVAEALANYENLADYDRGVRRDDSVELIAYRREHHAYGALESMLAVERHFTESSEIAAEVIREGTGKDERRGLGLAFLLRTLADLQPDRRLLVDTLTGGRERMGADLESAFQARRDVLTKAAGQAWEGVAGEPAVERWLASSRALRVRLTELDSAGLLDIEPPASPLAWQLDGIGTGSKRVALILMRCLHLVNNRMGLSVHDEIYLGYLGFRAIADLASPGELP